MHFQKQQLQQILRININQKSWPSEFHSSPRIKWSQEFDGFLEEVFGL